MPTGIDTIEVSDLNGPVVISVDDDGNPVSVIQIQDGIASGGGSGNVSNSGTPATHQVAIWTGATAVKGNANLTYNSGTDVFATGAATTVLVPYLLGIEASGVSGFLGDIEQYAGGFGHSWLGLSNFTGERFINVTDAVISSGWGIVASGLTVPDALLSASCNVSDTNWRQGMFGLNIGFDTGGASLLQPDATRTGWGLAMEADFMDPFGEIQHEAYFTTNGAERPFLIGMSPSVPAVVPGPTGIVTNAGGSIVTITAPVSGIAPYLRAGMRFYFTSLVAGVNVSVGTPYTVLGTPISATSFHLANASGVAITNATATSGAMDRGGWGLTGFAVPFEVNIGAGSTAPYSNYKTASATIAGEPVAGFGNHVAGHGATLTVKNFVAGQLASLRMQGGNGASDWNFTTLDHLTGPDFAIYEANGPYYALTIKKTTGFIGIGDTATAPASILHVGGTLTVGVSNTTTGSLALYRAGITHVCTFTQSASQSAATAYVLPVALPASDKVLQCTSAGVLSWVAAGSGGDITIETTAVIGGGSGKILYEGGDNTVHEDLNLSYNDGTGTLTAAFFAGDGSGLTNVPALVQLIPGTTTFVGTDHCVLFGDGPNSKLDEDSGFVYDDGTQILTVPNLALGSPLTAGNGGTGITSLGSGVATALGVNTGSAGAFTVYGGVGNFTTLTATGTVSLSPANLAVTLSPTGIGNVIIAPATSGTMNNMIIGATTPVAANFSTIGATTQGTGQFTTVDLGGTTDCTLNRAGAGSMTVEGVAVPTISSTSTLTNKRITKRVVTTTDDASADIDSDITDVYQLSAVANATTFTITGTPTDGQTLLVRYKDAGVSKALTWTAITAIGVTLPSATTVSKWGYVALMYNAAATAWHATGVTTEA